MADPTVHTLFQFHGVAWPDGKSPLFRCCISQAARDAAKAEDTEWDEARCIDHLAMIPREGDLFTFGHKVPLEAINGGLFYPDFQYEVSRIEHHLSGGKTFHGIIIHLFIPGV